MWRELPVLRRLALEISPTDDRFQYLHAAQLIKHVLGLRAAGKRFRLLYLWYDAAGPEGASHRAEIADFLARARADGVHVQTATYQEVIVALAKRERRRHGSFVDYIAERYL